MEHLAAVQEAAGCKILLAQKAFSLWPVYSMIREYLPGTCSSGAWEARLAHEKFGGEVHVYSPAYTDADLDEILPIAHHLSFNTPAQYQRFRERVRACGRPIECALRINPEVSTGQTPLYDPCVAGSRLGTTAAAAAGADLEGLEGLHFHTLCEQGSDALEATWEGVEARFGPLLRRVKWINMGGGHHLTRQGYDTERLIRLIRCIRAKYGLAVYLEPGEAIALGTGILMAGVLDTLHNAMDLAILDVSITCHMPDCLEMPYRPDIRGAGEAGELAYGYRLGGGTCLAGDVIGDYSFAEPLRVGQRLIFEDMAHYTMVKTSMFNGVKHPAFCLWDPASETLETVRTFRYEDFRDRMG